MALLLLHRPYITESAMLIQKHYHLWQSERALTHGDQTTAQQHAGAALRLDPESALAQVQLGRATPDAAAAQRWWRDAIDVLPAHPYGHLLLGNQLRAAGNAAAARQELAFEDDSLENLQRWALDHFGRAPDAELDIGNGLDLGAIDGFYLAQDDARWTRSTAAVQLAPGSSITFRARSPRPVEAPAATLVVSINGASVGQISVDAAWQTYTLPVPSAARAARSAITVQFQSTTFRPRDYDRASPDNRTLGVEVDWIRSQP